MPRCAAAALEESARRGRRRQRQSQGHRRRGVASAAFGYGIGNTSDGTYIANADRACRRPAAHPIQWRGRYRAGSNTILPRCPRCARLPAAQFALVAGETDLTADCRQDAASRQTFVGLASSAHGRDLRRQILSLANTGPERRAELEGASSRARWRRGAAGRFWRGAGMLLGEGTFDPPTRRSMPMARAGLTGAPPMLCSPDGHRSRSISSSAP